jgi:hypothetical protein
MTADDIAQLTQALRQFRMHPLPDDLMARVKGYITIDLDKRQFKNTLRHNYTNYDKLLNEIKLGKKAAALFRQEVNKMLDFELLQHPSRNVRKMAQRWREEDDPIQS